LLAFAASAIETWAFSLWKAQMALLDAGFGGMKCPEAGAFGLNLPS
jgi:hypothetical protein